MKNRYFKLLALLIALNTLTLPAFGEDAGPAAAEASSPVVNDRMLSGEVIVTATKTKKKSVEVPANATVITEDDIKKQNYQNLIQVLQAVPGMIVLDTGGETAFFGARVPSQFGAPAQMKVLVDGTEAKINSINVDVKQIEKIEVVRGPNSALYGSNTAGGVINIFLKKGTDKEKIRFSAQAGNFNDQILNLATQNSSDAYDYNVAANVTYTAGFRESNSAIQSNKYTGKIDYYIDSTSSVYLNFDRQVFPFKQGGGYLTRAQYNANPSQTTMPWILFTSDGSRYGAGYQKSLSDTQSISFDIGYSTSNFVTLTSLATTGLAGFRATSADALLDNKLKYTHKNLLVPNSELVTGIDYGTTQSDGYTNPAPNGVVNTASRTADALSVTRPLALYVQDEFSIADQWKLTLGGRYDSLGYDYTDRLANMQRSKVDGALTPRATLSYLISGNSNVYIGYGQSFTPPTQAQLFKGTAVAQPNANLVPELATNYEIGYKLSLENLNLSAALFNTDVTNSIVIFTDPATLVSQYQNAGSSRYYGLELSADYRLTPNWLISLGYTLEDAKFITYKTKTGAGVAVDYSGKNVNNVPSNNAVLTLRYNAGSFTASLMNRYNSGSYPGADNVVFYGGYFLTDLTFSFIRPDYELYLSGRNLFNVKYISYESATGVNESILPGAPFSLIFGITLKF